MTDLKGELLTCLRGRRAVLLGKLDGLSEYDRRRPMTPTGTSLLGLVKHLAGLEYGYLGESFGRPPVERPTWFRDDPHTETWWATPEESSDYIIGTYRKACAHADVTVVNLDLDAPGRVAHWPDGHQDTTLGAVLTLMVSETAQHAGHADIVRELIDGQIGDGAMVAADWDFWREMCETGPRPQPIISVRRTMWTPSRTQLAFRTLATSSCPTDRKPV